MAVAGAAWGAYSLLGRRAPGDPVVTTSSSFARSLPFAGASLAIAAPLLGVHVSSGGVALAATSGALASGAGYSVWYAALPHLSATRAAVLQLLVPVIAAAAAVAWLGEHLSVRLVGASIAILGGVALTIGDRAARR
jgi:drug/metabolite transporter (DMT)-like permease